MLPITGHVWQLGQWTGQPTAPSSPPPSRPTCCPWSWPPWPPQSRPWPLVSDLNMGISEVSYDPLGMALLPAGRRMLSAWNWTQWLLFWKPITKVITANQNSKKALKFNHFQLYHVVSVVFSNYYYWCILSKIFGIDKKVKGQKPGQSLARASLSTMFLLCDSSRVKNYQLFCF